MKLRGTRFATAMWRRRDNFQACVYGNLYDCTVYCTYFNQGDTSWQDDGNANTVILYSPNDYVEFSEHKLKKMFEKFQEQAYLSGKITFNRLTNDLQEQYKPVRDEAFERITELKQTIEIYNKELERLKNIVA